MGFRTFHGNYLRSDSGTSVNTWKYLGPGEKWIIIPLGQTEVAIRSLTHKRYVRAHGSNRGAKVSYIHKKLQL